MSHITASDNWLFEIKAVRAIKCQQYGNSYSAIATISIVDGEAHVEGLLSKEGLNAKDSAEIETYLMSIGFKSYQYSRYKNGEKTMVTKVIVSN